MNTKLLLILFVMISSQGCHNWNISEAQSVSQTHDIIKGKILSVKCPTTVAIGDTATIEVSFSGGVNGCAKADHLNVTKNKEAFSIEAFYNYPKKPSICTMQIPMHSLTYSFTPEKKGVYTFYDTKNPDISASIEVK